MKIQITQEHISKRFNELMKAIPLEEIAIKDQSSKYLDTTLEENDFVILNPAQDFIGTKAYVTVSISIRRENKIVREQYLISSDHTKTLLNDIELAKQGLYFDRMPRPNPRWSKSSMKAFLEGKVTGNIENVFMKITDIFRRFVDFSDPKTAECLALWVIGTYFHRMFSAYPYLHFNGNLSSGKSKVLQVISLFSFNAEHGVGNSPAYTIRSIHDNSSTCCVDEAENLKQIKDEDLKTVMMMYNSGYKKGAMVGKAELIGKQWVPKQLDPYSPKVFAGIKELIPTLASRCIPIMMVNSSNIFIKNSEINESDPLWQEIRDELYLIMMDFHQVIHASNAIAKDDVLQGREWEVWRPILAIANVIDNAKDDLFKRMRSFALDVQKNRKEAQVEDSTATKLLLNFKELLINNGVSEKFYSVGELLDYLKIHDEESFDWLVNNKHGRWLGEELRKAGIVTGRAEQRKIQGSNTKGFILILSVIEDRLKSFNL